MGQAHRRHSAQDKVAFRLFDFWASWLAEDMRYIGAFTSDLSGKGGERRRRGRTGRERGRSQGEAKKVGGISWRASTGSGSSRGLLYSARQLRPRPSRPTSPLTHACHPLLPLSPSPCSHPGHASTSSSCKQRPRASSSCSMIFTVVASRIDLDHIPSSARLQRSVRTNYILGSLHAGDGSCRRKPRTVAFWRLLWRPAFGPHRPAASARCCTTRAPESRPPRRWSRRPGAKRLWRQEAS